MSVATQIPHFHHNCVSRFFPDCIMSGGQPKSLLDSGSGCMPAFDIAYNENEFGVIQSPHNESYLHNNHQLRGVSGPWVDKKTLKPFEISTKTPELAVLSPEEEVLITAPPLTKSQSSKDLLVSKITPVYDENYEEMFQLDEEGDDVMLAPLSLSYATKERKMSKSYEVLPFILDKSASPEPEVRQHSFLQRFKSDPNLSKGESDMSLVEKVSMMHLTAAKKNQSIKSSTSQQTQTSQDSFENDFAESEKNLKNWFFKKPVSVSQREMNAIAPFS